MNIGLRTGVGSEQRAALPEMKISLRTFMWLICTVQCYSLLEMANVTGLRFMTFQKAPRHQKAVQSRMY